MTGLVLKRLHKRTKRSGTKSCRNLFSILKLERQPYRVSEPDNSDECGISPVELRRSSVQVAHTFGQDVPVCFHATEKLGLQDCMRFQQWGWTRHFECSHWTWDTKMLAKLAPGYMVAFEAMYHKNCLCNLGKRICASKKLTETPKWIELGFGMEVAEWSRFNAAQFYAWLEFLFRMQPHHDMDSAYCKLECKFTSFMKKRNGNYAPSPKVRHPCHFLTTSTFYYIWILDQRTLRIRPTNVLYWRSSFRTWGRRIDKLCPFFALSTFCLCIRNVCQNSVQKLWRKSIPPTLKERLLLHCLYLKAVNQGKDVLLTYDTAVGDAILNACFDVDSEAVLLARIALIIRKQLPCSHIRWIPVHWSNWKHRPEQFASTC